MRKLFVTMTVLVLAAGQGAVAQTAGRTGATNPSPDKQAPWPAPVGHRQPHIDQVPSENNVNNSNDAINREDAVVDRKLKSICRGC
jgi:hypothetical protein